MRANKSIWVVFTIVVIFSLSFFTISFGAEKFILKPKLAAKWQTDSNYHKAETTKREVYTYLVQPGLEFGYETAKSLISLDYTLDAHYYEDQDDVPAGETKAEEDDFVGHTLAFQARTKPFDRLMLGLDNSFYKTRDPAQSDALGNTVARDKYSINRLTPLIFYEFEGRFSLGLRYRNTQTDYDLSTNEDSTEHRGMIDLIYNFSETASLGLQYQRWDMDYDLTTSDYTSDKVMLILKKQFKNFSFEAGGGYHERDFDDAALESFDTPSYRVAVLWGNVPENPRSTFSIIAERDYNDAGTGDSYFTAHKVKLNASHIFLEKIKVEVSGSYQNSDYERTTGTTPAGTTELRDDDTYKIDGSIGYLFTDMLTFSIGSGYEDRDSNLSGKDYDNTTIWARLDFAYDFDR